MKTLFLKELIENNPRVILPDFGAFLVKDDGTSVFKAENITFSPFLRYNDGMVEDALATKLKLTKDKAKENLANYVEELKTELHSKKIFVISELGSLYIDKRGSIQFSVDVNLKPTEKEATDATISAVTKEEIKVEDVTEAKTSKEVEVTHEEPLELEITKEITEPVKVEKEPLPKPQPKKVEKVEEKSTTLKAAPIAPSMPKSRENEVVTPKTYESKTQPTHSTTKTSSSGGTGKAILYGTLIGVGFVAILATGWYLYSNGLFGQSEQTTKTSEPSTQILLESDNLLPAEEAKFDDEFEKLSAEMDADINLDKDESTPIPNDKRLAAEPPVEEHKINLPAPREGMFHLIVGSFRNGDYAEKYSNDMTSLGYNSKVLIQQTGMHAVSLGSFINREQAVDSMNVWKQNLPNIWILQQ